MSSTGRGPAAGRGRSRLRLVTGPPAGSPDPRSGGDDLLDPSVRRFSGRDPERGPERATPGRRPAPRGSGAPPARREPPRRRPEPDGHDPATEYWYPEDPEAYEAVVEEYVDDPQSDLRAPASRRSGTGPTARERRTGAGRTGAGAARSGRTGAGQPGSSRTRAGRTAEGRDGTDRTAAGRAARPTASRGGTSRGATANPRTDTSRVTPHGATARAGTTRASTPRAGTTRAGTARAGTQRGAAVPRNPTRSTASRTEPVRVQPARRARSSRGGPPRGRAGAARRGLGGAAGRTPRPFVLASPRRRVRVAVVLMVAVLVVIAARLAQLQGFASSTYAEQAEQQLRRKSVLPADRGMITDRHGGRLAQDIEQRAVYADPLLMTPSQISDAARRLAPVVGRSENELRSLMTSNAKERFVYLGRGLDRSVGDEVTELDLYGIGVLEERGRWYSLRTLGANFVGFANYGDNDTIVGRAGLEQAYDSVLRGTDGRRQIEADPSGREIPSAQNMEKEPLDGSTLRLTIDNDIQWQAQRELAEAVRTYEADGGTIVVMKPRTGELLAMADAPQFDPNNITERDLDAIGNRSTGQAFEPGSVNKVITMAAALDRGLIDAMTPITVPPSIERGRYTITDSEPHGTEHLTAAGVLARSSNIGTVLIAEKVGNQRLEEMMRAFGLGAVTELDFPGETAGALTSASQWSESQAATIAYGQGMSATALQMASVYATVANGGMRVAPRLVDAVITPDGEVQETAHEPERRVVSPETAATLTRMLEEVATEDGTAPLAEVAGYRVAGKTGTATRYDPVSERYDGYVSSFVGFAPADDPQVVVEVVLDNPRTGYYGGQVAAPVFAEVMKFALTTLGVPPPGTRPDSLVLDLDR
ncbi:peptidoglycan D,D-transpeptidase FtsI family protein [Parafrankia sp. FMc2]|uniref:peptidoglycan D,D-transpeptidase FtsI family protein n=1 Tax=Parafrankia sp. FMc2 TaxID=3233196 RepID=UPI0034D73FF4